MNTNLKILIVSFFVILFNYINAQSKKDSIINYKDINGKKQAWWIKKYDNGNIAYKAYFINDIPVGEYYRYYYTGKPKAKIIYDKRGNGKAVLYWDNGKIMAEGNYVDIKIKDSIWNMYATDGALIVKIEYNHGLKNGKEIKYFRNKYPSEIISWKNGIRDGIWRWYYDGSKVRMETKYINGKRNGPFRVYYQNGNFYVRGYYKNNLRDGKWIIYEYDGKIKQEVNYEKGIPDNELQVEQELTKQLEEWEQNKGKIPEPTIESLMNSHQRRQ